MFQNRCSHMPKVRFLYASNEQQRGELKTWLTKADISPDELLSYKY